MFLILVEPGWTIGPLAYGDLCVASHAAQTIRRPMAQSVSAQYIDVYVHEIQACKSVLF